MTEKARDKQKKRPAVRPYSFYSAFRDLLGNRLEFLVACLPSLCFFRTIVLETLSVASHQ